MLTFPAQRQPEVSVVTPLYGRWEWTERALRSLHANTEPVYEVIAVDNASPDETVSRLESMTSNVRVIKIRRNVGFGIACNLGEASARAPLVLFLNSDALVQDGWLRPLIEAVRRPGVGAAGPRYLHLDGTIQEAGALLYRDALTVPYGPTDEAQDDVDRPRTVDYLSAACLMVHRQAFAEVGGFDPSYAPAYYEDVDLCLALADCGHRTVYEPRSRVVHAFGWADVPRDEQLLARNHATFTRRWSSVLAARPDVKQGLSTARDAPLADRVLVAAGRSPAAAARLACRISRAAPAAYVAMTGAHFDEQSRGQLRARGVAFVDPSRSDRYHFDVVAHVGDLEDDVARRILAAQPQAEWRTGDELESGEALLDLGVDAVGFSAGDGVDDIGYAGAVGGEDPPAPVREIGP